MSNATHRGAARAARVTAAVAGGLALAGLLLLTPPAATAGSGCHVDGVRYKILGEGRRIWIGTNIYSKWKPGPATISRTRSLTATAGSSHGSSDSVDVGVNYLVVSAKYNHTWNRSTTASSSHTRSWTYGTTIPKGMTARVRIFKVGRSFPARKIVTYRKGSSCPVVSRSWRVQVRLPVKSTTNKFYCDARDRWPASKFIRSFKCVNT